MPKSHLILASLAFSLSLWAQDDITKVKEMYMANEAGGHVVLTLEECKFAEAVRQGLDSRAYSTESNGIVHEGCWNSPSIAEAPKNTQMRIIPLVNTWWDEDRQITTFATSQFGPIKTKQ